MSDPVTRLKAARSFKNRRQPTPSKGSALFIGAELGATPKPSRTVRNANGCAVTIYGNYEVRIDRMVQVSIPAGGRGGAGERPPASPCRDPRSVAPKGRLALPPQSGDSGQSRAASACRSIARTSYDALPAPVPGRVRKMSSPEWFARSR